MKRVSTLAGLALGLAVTAPCQAVPGGEIGTLPIGRYLCELPGDAARGFRIRAPSEDIEIISASSYVADGKRGTYLLTGDLATITSGPRKGLRLHRTSYGVLKPIAADGQDGILRCILAGRG